MVYTLESIVKATLVISLFMATLAPYFITALDSTTANELNMTATNSTGSLNNLVFTQVNNTAFCGSAGSCPPSNRTGGFNVNPGGSGGIFSAFAFVLNGFGALMTSLINTPFIMSTWTGELFSVLSFPITTVTMIEFEMRAFYGFIIVMVGISVLMKSPIRSI